MASVSSERTDLEQRLAKEMWRLGLRGWRRGRRTAGARPDFVFVGARVAVFVDGCFWHGCPACGKRPASNVEYWRPKIARNRERDAQQTRTLQAEGWVVIRLWGHDVERDAVACTALVSETIASASL